MFLGYYPGGEAAETTACILGYSLYFKNSIEEDKTGTAELNCTRECADLSPSKLKIKGELT